MILCTIVVLASYLLLLLSYPETSVSFRTKLHCTALPKNWRLSFANGYQQLRNTLERKHARNALQDNVPTTTFTLRSATLVDEVDQSASRTSLKDLIRTPLYHDRNGIVIIAGFEAFNVQLYRKAAGLVM
jgi:hypothetical protein